MVAERLFSLTGEDSMSEQAKTSEEAQRGSENERSHYALPPDNDLRIKRVAV
jgi:hypothetical protein